ncbi:MAG: undecaprenyldiphospho-muramoylpentapeptide beta-N-acetylglucosaminyltransferase [Litorilituus sp.]|jgi:UDP-N-acetylglucosamine--N-acetylmuramyl-(pentapeptide) pyrophosphoryl-undecaprenol N-acetylglucosamine transferase|nr:undecaprenyldiphospho-muramoylpentapeptide beta-N-acetylglucosaminyltransferase [Litorilituus sp.]
MSPHNVPTLLVMAGGTGGHIFPGLAVADMLKQQGWHIHWLGTADRMEASLVPEHGYDISFVNISGLRNKGLVSWLTLPFKLIKSLWQAIKIIKQTKPDVVLGMGGYASAPGGLATWLMKKPLVVHEQNAAAGLTNRLLSRIATIVCCAFPDAFHSKVNAQVVGNPLRASIGEQDNNTVMQSEFENSYNVLVVGGSLGAQILNQMMPQSFEKLITAQSMEAGVNIWHQTGKDKQEQVISAYTQFSVTNEKIRVTEFIKDMASAYQWADIVLCRAGALTVSELAMAATPAIFVPLPHAVDDHQTKNAQYLVACGGAKIMKQSELTVDSLTQEFQALFSTPEKLKKMAKLAFEAAHPDATSKVADICQQLLPDNKQNALKMNRVKR